MGATKSAGNSQTSWAIQWQDGRCFIIDPCRQDADGIPIRLAEIFPDVADSLTSGRPDQESRARLMAAAPELRGALRKVLSFCCISVIEAQLKPKYRQALRDARAALRRLAGAKSWSSFGEIVRDRPGSRHDRTYLPGAYPGFLPGTQDWRS